MIRNNDKVMRVDIVLTRHAIRRMLERGCNPNYVIRVLHVKRKIILVKNRRGFEIVIPYKGRLVGDFDKKDGKRFIVKSFLYSLAPKNRIIVKQIYSGRIMVPRYLC